MVEVAMVGHEGLVGMELGLGSRSCPLMAVMQEGGTALRADAEDFDHQFDRSAALRAAMGRLVIDRMLYSTLLKPPVVRALSTQKR